MAPTPEPGDLARPRAETPEVVTTFLEGRSPSTAHRRLLELLQPGAVLYPPGLIERLQANSEMLTASNSDGLYVLDSKDRYVYHYTKSRRAVRILRSGQLRMSPFIETIDPRENKDWVFSVGAQQPQEFAGVSIDETEEVMRDSATKLAKNRCKLLCFTEDDERAVPGGIGNNTIYSRGFCHPRMWAQYADGYEGVCMIFDRRELQQIIENSFRGNSLLFQGAVTYRNKRQVAQWANDPFTLDFDSIRGRGLEITIRDHIDHYWRELFFEKAEDWANEREFRWLAWVAADEAHFVPFSTSLKAIIVGHAFDNQLGHTLMEYRDQHDVHVAQLHWQNGVPFLWGYVVSAERRRFFLSLFARGRRRQ